MPALFSLCMTMICEASWKSPLPGVPRLVQSRTLSGVAENFFGTEDLAMHAKDVHMRFSHRLVGVLSGSSQPRGSSSAGHHPLSDASKIEPEVASTAVVDASSCGTGPPSRGLGKSP